MPKTKWILYPPLQPLPLVIYEEVFIKTKSKKETGRKGQVTELIGEERVMVKIPINGKATICSRNAKAGGSSQDNTSFYTASYRPNRLVPIINVCDMESKDSSASASTRFCTIVITRTTDKYRLLAASQLRPTDHVLEIGCSNGECSLVIAKYVSDGSLVGIDVSNEMVQQAKSKIPEVKGCTNVDFHVVDPFGDPRRALMLATGSDNIGDSLKKTSTTKPDVVFIDIGGNRDLTSVVKMLSWVRRSFSPRLCIIKSEEIVDQIKADSALKSLDSYEPAKKRLKSTSMTLEIESDGTLSNGQEWFEATLHDIETNLSRVSTARPRFLHPQKAPLSLSPIDNKTPICRYHNWHKNGCLQTDCPLDHDHCHWCLKLGHTALSCTNAESSK